MKHLNDTVANTVSSVKEITKDEYIAGRQISAYKVRNNPSLNR